MAKESKADKAMDKKESGGMGKKGKMSGNPFAKKSGMKK